MIAVILASGRLDRLYTGLSLLVSVAAEGEPARGLVTFAALEPMLDERLEQRALASQPELFARAFAELRATAAELPDCLMWACAAAVETTGLDPAGRLDGVCSMPRFLREIGDARLVVV
jgi:peroxiredoxin family protein